jgi:hypothetical protein
MKLLCFQARRFCWKSFSKTLAAAADHEVADELRDCVVVFLHAERKDQPAEERRRVFKHTLKHVKWLANKRGFTNIVLHSFTHLGGDTADADYAGELMIELDERLATTGYTVKRTPFGYFCEWGIEVHGESMAKVWKEL